MIATLAELCDRKFWAPTGMETGSITAWRTALGAPGGQKGYLDLIDAVASSSVDPAGPAPPSVLTKALTELHRATRTVYANAGSTGVEAAIDSFLAAEQVDEAWNALRSYDPIGRHEVATEGTAAVITPFDRRGSNVVAATISQPCRINTGKTVHLLDTDSPAKAGSAQLAHLSYDPARGFIGEFRPAPAGGKNKTMTKSFSCLDRALDTHQRFIMVPDPYLGGRRSGGRARSYWTSSTADKSGPVGGREVPFDVAHAAQTGGAAA